MNNIFAYLLVSLDALIAVAAIGMVGCSPRQVPSDPTSSPAPSTNSAATPDAIAGGPDTTPPLALAGPKMVLEQTQYDFGKMETNGAGRHEFVLANRGDRPLVLGRGKNSCGCCTCVCDARLPDRGQIPPGGSAKVVLEWSIKQYVGNFSQSETLTTNDFERPEVTLEVRGRITPVVRVVPAQLVFNRVPAGQPAVGEVRLYGYRSEVLKVLGHALADPATADSFTVTYKPLPADEVAAEADSQSGYLVRIEVKPSVASKPFRQQVVLKTNLDSAPELEIPVEGSVGSELTVAGFGWDEHTGVVTLGTVAINKGTTRKLQVVVRGPQAQKVKLKPVRIVPDLVQVDVGQARTLGQGAVTQIPFRIRIPPGSRAANYLGSKAADLGQIVFETGHPKQPELRLLVRFAVRPDPGK